MRAKIRAFTLVELLVVIGIIALLISMLLPALGKAQKAARTAQCLSNLRQCAMAFRIYAAENKDWVVTSVTVQSGYSYPGDASGDWAGNHRTWPRYLTQGRSVYGEPGGPIYLKSAQVTLCPSHYLYANNSQAVKNNNLSEGVAYGVYAPNYYELAPRGYRHVPTTPNPGGWIDVGRVMTFGVNRILVGTYRLSGFRKAAETIFLADVIASYEDHQQSAEFSGEGLSFNNAAIHLAHNKMANVAFFDGHAATMTARSMRYETANAPNRFWAERPGPGGWDTTQMFVAPYENIAYPAYPAMP